MDSSFKIFIIGAALVLVGFTFNFAETWYFGWNARPQSVAEMICDYISHGAMIVGWLIVLYSTMIFTKEVK